MESVPSVMLLPQHLLVWQDNSTSHLVDPLLAVSMQDGGRVVQLETSASVSSLMLIFHVSATL